jgi:hypothetical protein
MTVRYTISGMFSQNDLVGIALGLDEPARMGGD